MLFAYAVFFSFAYVSLSAGTGALILFGAVQLTMFARAFHEREHFPPLSWVGSALALGGLVWLVLPGLTAPDPLGAALMALSGVAWGLVSLLARGADHPVEANAANFALCVPLAAGRGGSSPLPCLRSRAGADMRKSSGVRTLEHLSRRRRIRGKTLIRM